MAAILVGAFGAAVTLFALHRNFGIGRSDRLASDADLLDLLGVWMLLQWGAILLLGCALVMVSRTAAKLGSVGMFLAGIWLTCGGIRLCRITGVWSPTGGAAVVSGGAAMVVALLVLHAALAGDGRRERA